jgi:16S rRNA (cytosine967-C5)-methyltransferase
MILKIKKEAKMQENARWQAILELYSDISEDKKPADNIINEYFRSRRYIGGGDRRFITDHIWRIVRSRRKLEFDAKSKDPRKVVVAYLKDDAKKIFTGEGYSPQQLLNEEMDMIERIKADETPYPSDVEAETPKWLFNKIKDLDLCKSLNNPAPADFRINVKPFSLSFLRSAPTGADTSGTHSSLLLAREAEIDKLGQEGLEFQPTPYSPIGIRSESRVNLNNCMAYKEGEIEVQDEASQIAAILADAKPHEKIIDYCCGAGGKSLTMSYLMQDEGKIFAHDINWNRLEAIKDRAQRLNATNIEIIKELTDTDYDLFLLDSPCSGSGTWRRSPDAKFRLTEIELAKLNKSQKELLNFGAKHVKQGGRIVYITCSILKDENEDRIEEFLKNNQNFVKTNIKNLWDKKIPQPYPCDDAQMLRMSPLTTNTDGFFICILQKSI